MILRARLGMLAVVVLALTAFLLVFQPLTFHIRRHPIDRSLTLKPVGEAPLGPWRLYIHRPQPALKLGLDLQGGLRVTLRAIRGATLTFELGERAETEEAQAEVRQRILALLDPTEFPNRAAELNPAGDAVLVRVPAADAQQMDEYADRVLDRLRAEFPQARLAEDGKQLSAIDPTAMQTVQEIMRRRVDQFGVTEPNIHLQGQTRVVIELPGLRDPEEFVDLVKTTAKMEWVHVPADQFPPLQQAMADEDLPRAEQLYTEEERRRMYAEVFDVSTVVLSGDELRPTSQAQPDPTYGTVVTFQLKPAGARKWAEFTQHNIGQVVAIVLDGVPVSAPEVQGVMSDSGQIQGTFTVQEATRLATLLNAGALPLSLEIIQQELVSPTLGRDSLAASLYAGIIGLVIILAFMLLYYRVPGLVADLALVIYGLLLLGVFWMVGITLTLPGIVGVLLTLGMAVDANIIIFERVKEELRSGKTLRTSIETGFARAWTAVLDASVTTLIAAAVLYFLGTGPVKGFAVALFFGVSLSLFTAVTVSRQMMMLLANTPLGQKSWLFGARPAPAEAGTR